MTAKSTVYQSEMNYETYIYYLKIESPSHGHLMLQDRINFERHFV